MAQLTVLHVSDPRGATSAGCCSTNTPTGHPGSGHRHVRWRHRIVTGTTPGTSCSARTCRPRPTATTPHAGQPISCHGVETVTVMPVGPRSTCSTWTPSRPSRRSQRAHGTVVDAPRRAVALDTVEVLETIGSLVASDLRGPRPHQPRNQPTGEPPPLPKVRHSYRGASSGRGRGGSLQDVADQWVELAGEVALEAADDLHLGSAFGGAAGHVVAGGGVVAHAHDHDVVERGVGLPVPAPVESVPVGLARGRRDRTRAGQRGEVSL